MVKAVYTTPKIYRKIAKKKATLTEEDMKLPVYENKYKWVLALERGEFSGFPSISNESKLPLDFESGPIGFYEVTKGFVPLFAPSCPVDFSGGVAAKLNRLYEKEHDEIFILPVYQLAMLPNVSLLKDEEVQRCVGYILNTFDVHCILNEEQVSKLFGKNLFSSDKYFITSLNNYHSKYYYSQHHFEFFDEIKKNLETISDKIAVNYKNPKEKFYRIDFKKANEVLTRKKLVLEHDNKTHYVIPYDEFVSTLTNRTTYRSEYNFRKIIEYRGLNPKEFFDFSQLISLKRKFPDILIEKRFVHEKLGLKLTKTSKISDRYVDCYSFAHLKFHPSLNLSVNPLDLANVYNMYYKKYFIDTNSFLSNTRTPLLIEEFKDYVKIPYRNIKNFILQTKKIQGITYLGSDTQYGYFTLSGDALNYKLKIIVTFSRRA